MRPVVEISCLEHDHSERWYVNLYEMIVREIVKADVGILDSAGVVVQMPTDLMKKGLGNEITVKIDFGREDQSRMLDAVLKVVRAYNQNAFVQGYFTYIDVHHVLHRLYVSM